MQNKSRGVVTRTKVGLRRALYLGHGPARRLLLGALATIALGCGSKDLPAEPSGQAEAASSSSSSSAGVTPLGTKRAPLVTNTVLRVVGDTFIRAGLPNENEGDADDLSVQTSSRHRALLFFDPAAISAAVGNGTLQSAHIELFIQSNGFGWGPGGRPIAIHALRQASGENTATWNCAVDNNVSNQLADCTSSNAWNMNATNATLPFVLTPSATAQIGNGTNGVVSFDVTQDVLAIIAGNQPGHGWIIKKVDENVGGSLRFAAREQGPAPQMTLTIDAPEVCSPTAANDVTCDGLDDDCDGTADEDFTSSPTECGVGACRASGVSTCSGGQPGDTCSPSLPAANDASCDLVDDDCDGSVDEDYAAVATSCGVGACSASGLTSCVLGQVVDDCQPSSPGPSDETCDGLDQNCDGSADEGYASAATACGIGACGATGSTSCVGGSVVDSCTPGPAAALDASCDGRDDDCDGSDDEDFAPSCAGAATMTCVAGTLHTTSCSDDNPCNGEESCTGSAQCSAGTPPVLDDGDPCTADACSATSGVTHERLSAGTACGEYRECNANGECLSILPPDPSEVAPALPLGTVSFLERVRFLYEAQPRIQTGVAANAIVARSAAVVRGRVLGPDGLPLPNVTVSVHGHPEYGQTVSRLDGFYDLVVNGGERLTLKLAREDVLEAHRTALVSWQDYTSFDDVRLGSRDSAVTHLSLPGSAPVLHEATASSDGRGTRRARVFVPSATTALLIRADGSSTPVSQLSLRASEIGVGSVASRSLLGELPATAASIYELELSASQAEQAAARVELSQPASVYVENFPALPVGAVLPLGTYRRDRAAWVGVPNGRVLELIGESGGLAQLDIDGSGTAAGAASLDALGIDAEELQAIAASYGPGDSFFRLPVAKLGAFDVSLPYSFSEGTEGVDPKAPGQLAPLDDATLPAAPAETRVLAQSLPLSGTPFTLHYRSNRVIGDRRGQRIAIPATGTSIGSGLLASLVDVQIAGQHHIFDLVPSASSVVNFGWDGLDAAGRALHGWQRVAIRVGLVAPQNFVRPDAVPNAFAHTAFGSPVIAAAPEPHVRWLRYERLLHTFDSRQTDIGAWSINQHHQFDPKSRVVYRGDGTSFATRTSSTIIDRFAGLPQVGTVGLTGGDGGPALSALMDSPRSLAVGPDGAVYIGTRNSVRRVAPGTLTISTVAGGDVSSCSNTLTEGRATDMCVFARSVDFGRDGALYIGDNSNAAGTVDRIRRLDLKTGRISHVAGVAPTAGCTNMGDGGLARDAALCALTAHANAPDGSIYLLDLGSPSNPLVVRKISTDGTIDSIANATWSGADESAGLAVGPDGTVYVAQTRSVLCISPTGEVRLCAGNPALNGNSGDGGPALLARFSAGGPCAVSVNGEGRLFLSDNGNGLLRMIDQQGIIRRVAGSTTGDVAGNGGPPLSAVLGTQPFRTAIGPDGSFYTMARVNHTVRAIAPNIVGDFAGPARVPSPDGKEIYRFSAEGRHLETTSANNGAVLFSFGYDSAGRLTSVTDGAGRTTRIERDTDGNPTSIIAPLGEETLLDTNGDGYISAFIGPTGGETEVVYDEGGLLTQMVDESGVEHDYAYDADGGLLP